MQELARHQLVVLSAVPSLVSLTLFALALSSEQKAGCPEAARIGGTLVAGIVLSVLFLLVAFLVARYYWREDRYVSPFAHLESEHIEGGEDEEEPFA